MQGNGTQNTLQKYVLKERLHWHFGDMLSTLNEMPFLTYYLRLVEVDEFYKV